jgi:hypothetical protein
VGRGVVVPPAPTGAPCPVVRPETWLGAVGWRRAGGLIDPREGPAGIPRSNSKAR